MATALGITLTRLRIDSGILRAESARLRDDAELLRVRPPRPGD
jgi:hypothetical protein